MTKRLTITVLGRWQCNTGEWWIARRRTASQVVVKPSPLPVPDDAFPAPQLYGPAPCPAPEVVLAVNLGFTAPQITDHRTFARACRDFLKKNLDLIPYEEGN